MPRVTVLNLLRDLRILYNRGSLFIFRSGPGLDEMLIGGLMHMQSLSGAWQFRQAGTAAWWPAQVPGGVHTDLLALGQLPDPFVGDNEKHVQWVAEADWEYRCY